MMMMVVVMVIVMVSLRVQRGRIGGKRRDEMQWTCSGHGGNILSSSQGKWRFLARLDFYNSRTGLCWYEVWCSALSRTFKWTHWVTLCSPGSHFLMSVLWGCSVGSCDYLPLALSEHPGQSAGVCGAGLLFPLLSTLLCWPRDPTSFGTAFLWGKAAPSLASQRTSALVPWSEGSSLSMWLIQGIAENKQLTCPKLCDPGWPKDGQSGTRHGAISQAL